MVLLTDTDSTSSVSSLSGKAASVEFLYVMQLLRKNMTALHHSAIAEIFLF